MPKDELEKRIAQVEPPITTLDSIAANLSKLIRLVEGWTDHKEGKRHKGLLERLEELEDQQEQEAVERAKLESQRLTWKTGLGLASAGAIIAQALNWIGTHVKLGGS